MICPHCQNECRDSDRYCFRCGAPLYEPVCPKKGSHKVPLLILALLSVIGIILYFTIPTGTPRTDTPWFTVTDGVLYFDQTLYIGGSELTVPETLNGQTVTELSEGCFRECTEITAVILPDSLRVIGASAFSGCTSLRGIFIPEGVTEIRSHAFANCSALEAVCIPSTVNSIGHSAFDGCEKLFYILFNGEFATWQSLYSHHINIRTHVYCHDGAHLHR